MNWKFIYDTNPGLFKPVETTSSAAHDKVSFSDLFCTAQANSHASGHPLPSSLDVGFKLALSYLNSALNSVTVCQYKGALLQCETFCAQNGLPLNPGEPV